MCVCFCFHSCESPSCGRRDVASCCCGSTCNTRFVSSVSRVTVVFCPSFLLFTVFLLFSRYAAECCGPAAAGYYEPAGHHHGKPSTWICVFFFLFLLFFGGINMSSFCFSGPADDHAGHGHGWQSSDESPHLPGYKPSHEPSANTPSQPVCLL